MLSAKEVAARAVAALEEKKGINIEILRIDRVTTLADYFVICTGTSNTHVNAMTNAVEAAMDEAGEPLVSREGHRSGTWVLLDFGCLIVHLFLKDQREFYDLERLWKDGTDVTPVK